MTETEYIHRLRGINEGQDLPIDFLKDLYKNITQTVSFNAFFIVFSLI